jgi:hypothetical protein
MFPLGPRLSRVAPSRLAPVEFAPAARLACRGPPRRLTWRPPSLKGDAPCSRPPLSVLAAEPTAGPSAARGPLPWRCPISSLQDRRRVGGRGFLSLGRCRAHSSLGRGMAGCDRPAAAAAAKAGALPRVRSERQRLRKGIGVAALGSQDGSRVQGKKHSAPIPRRNEVIRENKKRTKTLRGQLSVRKFLCTPMPQKAATDRFVSL